MSTERKHVTVKGITWTIVSSNERICSSCPGRHFFALRCHSGKPWAIIEMDRDLLAGSAREIGYLPHRLLTQHLSLAVLDITARGEVLPVRSMDTPLTVLTKPAGTEYLTKIGAVSTDDKPKKTRDQQMVKCPYCEGETPKQRGLTHCVHCYAVFAGKGAAS